MLLQRCASGFRPALETMSVAPSLVLDKSMVVTDSIRMPSPSAVNVETRSKLKTAWPDFCFGRSKTTLITQLMALGNPDFGNQTVTDDWLCHKHVVTEPIMRLYAPRCPPLIDEGKVQATSGASLFAAQIHAAVSGASAVNMLLTIAVKSQSLSDYHPNVFSIRTQGPQIELWVHYVTVEDDV